MLTYDELLQRDGYEERLAYLMRGGTVGGETFGSLRWLNQRFYASSAWKRVRAQVIARDAACDLAVPGLEVSDRILVHHMNPIDPETLEQGDPAVFDLSGLITVSHDTHNAIHYGRGARRPRLTERKPDDHLLWRRHDHS